MGFAILRTEKLKTLGNIGGSGSHVSRNRRTPNADPSRTDLNVQLVGSGDLVADVKKSLPAKYRKNAVLAVENLLTASPEFFDNMSDDDVAKWADENVKWARDFWGDDNVVSATLHLDESTPHIHLFAVPKIDGKLNCREFLGGRQKLQMMQDSYANAMQNAGFDLARGVRGSKRAHVSMKKLSGEAREVKMPKVYVNQEILLDSKKNIFGAEVVVEKQRHSIVLSNNLEDVKTQIGKLGQETRARKEAERRLDKFDIDNLREIPLETIAEKMGYEKSKLDKNKWSSADFAFSIKPNSSKFYNFTLGEGGGGAIDFIRNIEQVDYKQSLAILNDIVGYKNVINSIIVKNIPKLKEKAIQPIRLIEPKHDDAMLPKLKQWLENGRSLPAKIVDDWVQKGRVYASKFGDDMQAIFTNEGGFFRKNPSTGFAGWVRGSKPQPQIINPNNCKYVAICESHIDAMSFQAYQPNMGVCMVNGVGGLKSGVEAVKALGLVPIAALDNDDAARKSVENVRKTHNISAFYPNGKDWNEDLANGVVHKDLDFEVQQVDAQNAPAPKL